MEGGEASWAVGKVLELLPDAWSLGSSVPYTKIPRLMVCSFQKTKHLFMFKKYLLAAFLKYKKSLVIAAGCLLMSSRRTRSSRKPV